MSNLQPAARQRLAALFIENGLEPEDVFVSNRFTIIARTGIEKIAAKREIEVEFEEKRLDPEFVVIKAVGRMPIRGEEGVVRWTRVETYGSASKANNRTAYPVEMAEKRALSRVVLKLAGLYSMDGVIGEDEKPLEE
jgi:hypothetical protein